MRLYSPFYDRPRRIERSFWRSSNASCGGCTPAYTHRPRDLHRWPVRRGPPGPSDVHSPMPCRGWRGAGDPKNQDPTADPRLVSLAVEPGVVSLETHHSAQQLTSSAQRPTRSPLRLCYQDSPREHPPCSAYSGSDQPVEVGEEVPLRGAACGRTGGLPPRLNDQEASANKVVEVPYAAIVEDVRCN